MDPNDKYNFSDDDEAYTDSINPAAEALLDRSTALLNEIESFQRSLRHAGLERTVELRLFLNQVKSEHRCLQGLALESPTSSTSRHGVHASNLPYLEALWTHAKATTGITALCKSFSYAELGPDGRKKKKKSSVTVDIVAQNGLQWIKLSLLTPRRLLFEIAKAGWEEDSPSSDTDTPTSLDPASSPTLATASTSLSHLADSLLLAASQTRIQYLHPTITFLLPNLPPTTPEVQSFLTFLQSKGITVTTPTSTLPAPLDSLISTLTAPLSRRLLPLTQTLNLDTTILLALISDITHTPNLPPSPRYHPALLHQLRTEAERPILASYLAPILSGRSLITCAAAHARFQEIVAIVASERERARAELLFNTTLPPRELAERFQALSAHDTGCVVLPVEVVEDYVVGPGDPRMFQRVAGRLSAVNRGAFITGWKRGVTTVTSNRAVAKFVEAACVGGEGEEEGVRGPDVEVVESARSLLGKEKKIEV